MWGCLGARAIQVLLLGASGAIRKVATMHLHVQVDNEHLKIANQQIMQYHHHAMQHSEARSTLGLAMKSLR